MVSEVEESVKGYRNKLEITRDILLAAGNEGSRKTHIMYGANLSYKLLKRYLEAVSKAGLIERNGESFYEITEEGKLFLKLYSDYEEKRKEIREGINDLKNGRERLEKMLF